ncbi:hypothetical protein HOY82DRAFT_640209 [Tuber indicum]|nr:hypothetical protein HOY82DRAFT_640209 [Tuber indicum]
MARLLLTAAEECARTHVIEHQTPWQSLPPNSLWNLPFQLADSGIAVLPGLRGQGDSSGGEVVEKTIGNDSELDSDKAMGESDEERFADFVFWGSTSTGKEERSKPGQGLEEESGGDDESSKDGEGFIDISEMLYRSDSGGEGGLWTERRRGSLSGQSLTTEGKRVMSSLGNAKSSPKSSTSSDMQLVKPTPIGQWLTGAGVALSHKGLRRVVVVSNTMCRATRGKKYGKKNTRLDLIE